MEFKNKVKQAKEFIEKKEFKVLLNKFYYSKEKHIQDKEQNGVMSKKEYEKLFNTIYYAKFQDIEEDMEGLEEIIRYKEIILIKRMLPLDSPTSIVKTKDFDKIMLSKKIENF